jgi:hypothetical protein
MAFSSVSNMTVPAPGSDGSLNSQGLLMPKLQYRFRILFDNFGVSQPTTELTKQVIDFKRPSVGFGEIPIEIYNSRYYLAGKPTWESITVNLRDDASGQVSRLVGEQIQKQFDFSEQASAAAGIDYKFQLRCDILDGGNGAFAPTVLECWELYGCYVVSADYGPLSYSANEPITIALTMRFDNAVQSPTADAPNVGGVGMNVGRTTGVNVSGIGTPVTTVG